MIPDGVVEKWNDRRLFGVFELPPVPPVRRLQSEVFAPEAEKSLKSEPDTTESQRKRQSGQESG